MLNETFYLDGVSAKSYGIHLQAPVEISALVPVYEAISIPGRSGTIFRPTGAYENRTATVKCFCLCDNVADALKSVEAFAFSSLGYRKLTLSADQSEYWEAVVTSGPKIEIRAGKLAPFEIMFSLKPHMVSKS